jgi:hypothetical protein
MVGQKPYVAQRTASHARLLPRLRPDLGPAKANRDCANQHQQARQCAVGSLKTVIDQAECAEGNNSRPEPFADAQSVHHLSLARFCGFRLGLAAFLPLGLPSFISACGVGDVFSPARSAASKRSWLS